MTRNEPAGIPLSVLKGLADDAQVHASIAKSIMSEMLKQKESADYQPGQTPSELYAAQSDWRRG